MRTRVDVACEDPTDQAPIFGRDEAISAAVVVAVLVETPDCLRVVPDQVHHSVIISVFLPPFTPFLLFGIFVNVPFFYLENSYFPLFLIWQYAPNACPRAPGRGHAFVADSCLFLSF